MKELNIIHMIDKPNWVYDYLDRNKQLYSKHNIIIREHNKVTEDDLANADIVYAHSSDISIFASEKIPNRCKELGIPFIGQMSGESLTKYSHVDLLIGISPQTTAFIKEHYETPSIYLPESVNTKFFTPSSFNENRFNVAWVARNCPVKRPHLLDKLDFNIHRKADWGGKFFTGYRTQEPMKEFYKGVDCGILVSESEVFSQSACEFASCGLPFICPDLGGMELLIDKEWLVDVNPENAVVSQMNKKLHTLINNPKLRKEVGERNRNHVEKYFSWEANMPIWDAVFEAVYNKDYDTCHELSQKFISNFKEVFDRKSIAYTVDNTEYGRKGVKK